MASKNAVKKSTVKISKVSCDTSIAQPVKPVAAPQVPVKKHVGPTARMCPLVLDGEVTASDFSSADCLTCSEFDCRFCEAEQGSGSLRSRLFAVSDRDEDEGDENEWDIMSEEEESDESGGDEGCADDDA